MRQLAAVASATIVIPVLHFRAGPAGADYNEPGAHRVTHCGATEVLGAAGAAA